RLDSAAGARNVRIARAVQPLLEFFRAITGVNEVRVTVDQAGRRPSSRARYAPAGSRTARQVAHWTDPGDSIAADADRGIANRPITARIAHRRRVHVVQNQIEADRRHRSSLEASQCNSIAREDFGF